MTSELSCFIIISSGISSSEQNSSEWQSSRLVTSEVPWSVIISSGISSSGLSSSEWQSSRLVTSELPCFVITSSGISSFELSSSKWYSSRLMTSDLTNIIFRVISTASDVPASGRPAVAAGCTALRVTSVATISWLPAWVFCVFSNFPFDVLETTGSSPQGLVT